MTPKVGDLCIVVKTCHMHYLGKTCTCIGIISHPFGTHLFEFADGAMARGGPSNVRVISRPDTETNRIQEMSA